MATCTLAPMIEITRPWSTTWGEVLDALPALRRGDEIWFGDGPVSVRDRCLVVDSAELGEGDDVAPEARAAGLSTSLLKEQLEDVIANLERQVGQPSDDLILEGVAYYVDHDAFLTVADG
jgi:hypothetical protein